MVLGRACARPIKGSVITALGAKWHGTGCFQCALCSRDIGVSRFHEVPKKAPSHASATAAALVQTALEGGEGASNVPKVVCVECHDKEFLPKCGGCAEVIKEGRWHVYEGASFHYDCFKCHACRKPAGQG